MNNRIESAKTKAEIQLENVLKLHGSEVLLSLGQNRKRRQAADNLELSFTNVNSVTAVNKPIGSEIFHVYFKYVLRLHNLTPIWYIPGISRSVISGKKIQNLLFDL